jgi:L-alanine-DL-glutamate epimerase-like enolase superfamily enzyme
VRDGKPVIGYGFNSNGRYGQGALIRERFRPRVLEASREPRRRRARQPRPHKVWARDDDQREARRPRRALGGVGTIDMAVWDAVAKIEGKPLFQLLAERYGTASRTARSSSTRPAATTGRARASRA